MYPLSESVDMKEMQDPGMGCSHLELLLLGKNQEEFAPLCELVRQTGDEMVSFDHVSTTDKALAHLQQKNYDLLLCDYRSGSSPALHLVHEIRKNGRRIHILFLSDYLNQPVLPNIIQSETGNGDGSGLNGPPPRVGHPLCHRDLLQRTPTSKSGNHASQVVAGGRTIG